MEDFFKFLYDLLLHQGNEWIGKFLRTAHDIEYDTEDEDLYAYMWSHMNYIKGEHSILGSNTWRALNYIVPSATYDDAANHISWEDVAMA